MLQFSDGMSFDLDGALRLTLRSDGWYVVGEGTLMAVDSVEEGREFIEEQKAKVAPSAR
jgi:hypothetical protein